MHHSRVRAIGGDVALMHIIAGWVHRWSADGRRLQLTLTDDGVATLGRARELAASVTERLMAPLAGDERELLQGLLRKLCAGLEPQARTRLLPPGC